MASSKQLPNVNESKTPRQMFVKYDRIRCSTFVDAYIQFLFIYETSTYIL